MNFICREFLQVVRLIGRPLPESLSGRRLPAMLVSSLVLLLLAAQCNAAPTLPVPTVPTGPAVRVALLTPSSGEMATFGRLLRNGIIMAFDEWNNQGGIRGRRIEWTVYNTGCEFDQARQAVRQAIDDGLEFIIGPLCSEAAIAAAELAQTEGVLMISPTATHPLVTVDGQGRTRPTIFRASFAYPWQARAAAQLAYETLGARRAAVISFESDDYAVSLAESFAQAFSGQGGEIAYQTSQHRGEPDFKPILTEIIKADVDVIYLPAAPVDVNRLAVQLGELTQASTFLGSGHPPLLLGSDRWASTALDLRATEGSYYSLHFVSTDPRPVVQNWRETYKASFATEPEPLAALGYDAAYMIAMAIEQANAFEPAAVAEVLEQATFAGVTGPITFDRQHNPEKPVPIVHIEGEQRSFFTMITVHSSLLNFSATCALFALNCETFVETF